MSMTGTKDTRRTSFTGSLLGTITRNGVGQIDLTEVVVKGARDFAAFKGGRLIRRVIQGRLKDSKSLDIKSVTEEVKDRLLKKASEQILS